MSGKRKDAPPAEASESRRVLRSNSRTFAAASLMSESKVSGKKPRFETPITLPTGSPSTADQLATIEGTELEGDRKEVKNKIAVLEAEIESIKTEIEKVKDEIKRIEEKIEVALANAVMDPSPHPGTEYWIEEKNQLREDKKQLHDDKKNLCDEKKQLEDELKQLLKPQESEPVKKLVGIAKLAKSINAPSTFGKLSNWRVFEGIYHHRPPGPAEGALHVSLFSAALGNFCSKCENFAQASKPDKTCDFVKKLCIKMSKVYEFEADRQNCFNELFNTFLEETGYVCEPIGDNLNSDGSILVQTSNSKLMLLLLNLEVKNEKGSTASDCVMQNMAYFVKFWGERQPQHPRPRSFLLSLEGCMLHVHGAVGVKGEVYTDELCPPLTLLWQPDMPRSMERIVVWADALRDGLHELEAEMNNDQSPDPDYPYLVQLKTPSGVLLKFTYEREIKRRVFLAKLEDSDQRVVVKFSSLGNAFELHELLAKQEFAPRLLAHAFIQSTWHVSVMEYTPEDTEEDRPFTKEQKEQLKEAVKLMHNNGWVHGDFRRPNILRVGQTQRIHIIDFEFSGQEDKAVYPSFLNTKGIGWPKGVASGLALKKEHDLQMLKWICDEAQMDDTIP